MSLVWLLPTTRPTAPPQLVTMNRSTVVREIQKGTRSADGAVTINPISIADAINGTELWQRREVARIDASGVAQAEFNSHPDVLRLIRDHQYRTSIFKNMDDPNVSSSFRLFGVFHAFEEEPSLQGFLVLGHNRRQPGILDILWLETAYWNRGDDRRLWGVGTLLMRKAMDYFLSNGTFSEIHGLAINAAAERRDRTIGLIDVSPEVKARIFAKIRAMGNTTVDPHSGFKVVPLYADRTMAKDIRLRLGGK